MILRNLRLLAFDTFAWLAWQAAPKTGRGSSYEFTNRGFSIKRRTVPTTAYRSPKWPKTTTLRTTIRSFLFNKRLLDTVKSVDTALLKSIATISNAVEQHIAGPTLSTLSRKWPKAFPTTR